MRIKAIEWDGKQISKPGIYSKIPLESYHKANICVGPSISSSGLRKIFMESPAHFFAEWEGNPKRKEPKDKPHFVLGRALHHLVLGERFFAQLFCEQPAEYLCPKEKIAKKWNYNATACKEWRDQRWKEGRSILTSDAIENLRGMATRLALNPIVRAGALNGQIERSIFWKDKETGIWLKSRPDSIPNDADFVDLKTTDSVLWIDLVRTIGKFAYHMQGGLIRRAAREVLKIERPTFALIFCEKTQPWCERVVTVKDHDLDLGEKQNEVALRIFAECLKSNKWPGPGGDKEDAENIELSKRERETIEERLQYELPN